MALSFDIFAMLLLLMPFPAALLAPLAARASGKAAGWVLALVPAALFLNFLSMLPGIAAGQPVRFAIDWVPMLELRLSFFIDGLSLVFALLISGIGTFILAYSGVYLDGHRQSGRFLAFMLLFMGAMLGVVLSDSLVALFVFWELTSVASFLLIGFDHERPAARRAAMQALIVTSLGGLSLLAGGVLLRLITGTWEMSGFAVSTTLREAGWAYPWALGFILVAAFTKSAQWPFHFWLPGAMEAPTPVSAYLHSATMVQAGIYLLARLTPVLGNTPLWQAILCTIGGITLLWGALMALKQTDLKQLLAQTTIASLGLSVLLLGLGNDHAMMAVAAYFIAHALYKAGLFLIAGIIDKGTGTRDITLLGGLRDTLTISFIAASLAALSMFGVPPLLGYLAKEVMYAAPAAEGWGIATIAIMVAGNALLGTAALALVVRPFMGSLKPTPKPPHEGSITLWIGPVLFGLVSLAVVFAIGFYDETIANVMASSIVGYRVESHVTYAIDLAALPIWLSLATWVLSILIYLRLDALRGLLQALERRFSWSWDKGFDQLLFGLIRFAGAWTRLFHHGRLEIYLIMVMASLALVLLLPLGTLGGWPSWPRFQSMAFYEWGALALAAAGTVIVVTSRTRLGAVVALGIQGLAVALIFLMFGAPDLALTQLLVEALSVVILAFVMKRLSLSVNDPRPYEDWSRDGLLALVVGVAVAALLLRVLEGLFDSRLGDFFAANSLPLAHGRNIVNVILVDFRGLDTLGEISVVMAAGIAVLALLQRQHKRELPTKPKRAPRRKEAAS